MENCLRPDNVSIEITLPNCMDLQFQLREVQYVASVSQVEIFYFEKPLN